MVKFNIPPSLVSVGIWGKASLAWNVMWHGSSISVCKVFCGMAQWAGSHWVLAVENAPSSLSSGGHEVGTTWVRSSLADATQDVSSGWTGPGSAAACA